MEQHFIHEIESAFLQEDSNRLAGYLNLKQCLVQVDRFEKSSSESIKSILRQSSLSEDQQNFVHFHYLFLHNVAQYLSSQNDVFLIYASDHHIKKTEAFLKLYREAGGWIVEPLYAVIKSTRQFFKVADRLTSPKNNKYQKEAKRLFDSFFRYTMMGRSSTEDGKRKRQSALFIIINQFEVYFQLDTIQLCTNLMKSVSQKNFPEFDSFNLSERVTYKYFLGRILLLQDRIQEAKEALEYALAHCHPTATSNCWRILTVLTPIRIMVGQMPNRQHLEALKSQNNYLYDMVAAIKQGNVREVTTLRHTHESILIEKGLFLPSTRFLSLAYRNLMANVVKLYQEQVQRTPTANPKAAQRLDLKLVLTIFENYGEPLSDILREDSESAANFDLDRVKCILANLIFTGYIKGYIAFERNILVLGKSPFPNPQTFLLQET